MEKITHYTFEYKITNTNYLKANMKYEILNTKYQLQITNHQSPKIPKTYIKK
jgi:hypothetical protein